MTEAEYRALDAVNFSTLKELGVSPRRYKHKLEHPTEDNAFMARGRGSHCATFEPDAFPLRFVVWQGGRRAGKEWTAFCEAHQDETILTTEEYAQCLGIRDSVHAHPEIAPLLVGGEAEIPLVWTAEVSGVPVPLKARLDYARTDPAPGVLLDLKTTTKGIGDHEVANLIAYRSWHAQLAHYRNGLVTARGVSPDVRCGIIAVESEPPHDCALWWLDEDTMYRGEQLIAWLLKRLVECRAADKWEGAHPKSGTIGLPGWYWQPNEDKKAGNAWLMGEE